MSNLRQLILSCNDLKTERVEIPEWGTAVHVRTLTGAERAALLARVPVLEKSGKVSDFATWVAVVAACDEAGNRVFSDADFGELNGKNAQAVELVARAALKLNGMDKDAASDAGNG